MFLGNSRIIVFKLVDSIANNMERINTKKITQLLLLSVQSVEITFILFKCHRSIDNSIDFYLFVKRLMITKNSVVKIQNRMNHESRPVKLNPVNVG